MVWLVGASAPFLLEPQGLAPPLLPARLGVRAYTDPVKQRRVSRVEMLNKFTRTTPGGLSPEVQSTEETQLHLQKKALSQSAHENPRGCQIKSNAKSWLGPGNCLLQSSSTLSHGESWFQITSRNTV